MTKDKNNTVNQSKRQVLVTCSWREARENVCERVTIGFTFDWLKKWRELFKPIV